MTDIIDEANNIAEEFHQDALNKHMLTKKVLIKRNDCEECAEPLQEHRKPYGICISCQEELEEVGRLKRLRGE